MTPFRQMEDRGFDLAGRLDTLEAAGRARALSTVDRVAERGYFAPPAGGDLPVLDAEETLIFASNNYLGLTADSRVQDAARQAAATVGTGAGASRLATGDTMVHQDLERLLAEVQGTDRALTFSSGYAATVGTLTALSPDVIFADERSHQSIRDGCRLSGAELRCYDLCDPASLQAALSAQHDRAGSSAESWLIVTETVFNTDGEIPPLAAICDLAEQFGTWVMVDEAHATGLYADGGGVVHAEGLEDRIHIQMGTLSKALASQGGYVAGSDSLISCLVNDAHSFAYSTGLTPPAVAAASEALHLARYTDARDRLWENVSHLRDGLNALGFQVRGDSHILPVVLDNHTDACRLKDAVRDAGVATRVPDGTHTVRITPMATHDEADIVTCLEAFQAAGEALDLF